MFSTPTLIINGLNIYLFPKFAAFFCSSLVLILILSLVSGMTLYSLVQTLNTPATTRNRQPWRSHKHFYHLQPSNSHPRGHPMNNWLYGPDPLPSTLNHSRWYSTHPQEPFIYDTSGARPDYDQTYFETSLNYINIQDQNTFYKQRWYFEAVTFEKWTLQNCQIYGK